MLASAALDPDAAIAAAPEADEAPVEVETTAGVVAVERVAAMTMAVEVEPVPRHSRWRWFCCYCLLRLAAWVYPFKLELYRTRHPWED